jgi:hypothetical protein
MKGQIQKIPQELRERIAVIATLSMDTGLLTFWIFLQWLVGTYFVEKLTLTAIDKWTLVTVQIIFAISTSIAVGVYTWKDVNLIIIRAQGEIENEKKKLNKEQLKNILKDGGD